MKKSISYHDKPFKKWTDKQLIDDAKGLYSSIYVMDCYGMHDLIELDGITEELDRRGYEIQESKSINFVKEAA